MKRFFSLCTLLVLVTISVLAIDISGSLYYTISPRNNHTMFMKDTGSGLITCDAGVNARSYWRFIPTGNEGCFYLQNLATKQYAQKVAEKTDVNVAMGPEPVEYFVMSTPTEGTDCFGMVSTDHANQSFSSSACIAMNWKEETKLVHSYLAAVGTNHKSFWFIQSAEPPSCLITSHQYVHGTCTFCGMEDPSYVTLNENGFYEINDGYQLEWFSEYVNNGHNDANAILMNDIDMQGIDHTPIAKNVDLRYRGTFDGQGHRILNLVIDRPTQNIQGLFGYLRGNADSKTKICNLIIDKSCSFVGHHQVGAIAGCSQGNTGLITIENILNEADVTAEGGTDVGVICGGSTGNAPTWIIRNVVNTGRVGSTAEKGYAGMIAGWYGSNASNLQENIINLGTIYGFDGGNQMGRLTGTSINLIDLSDTEGGVQGVDHDFTFEDVTSGRLTYYLNGDQSKIMFTQTLGTDAYPIPLTTSKQVYMQGELSCDGTPVGDEGTYSNSSEGGIIPPHTFDGDDLYCSVCGKFNENYVQPIDGVLHMSTPNQLIWLAEYVAAGHGNLNVVMDNDIDMNGIDFLGIGSQENPFQGHFDGQYHTISNLLMLDRINQWSGFFNFIKGGSTIENLRLDEECYITGAKGTGMIGGAGFAGEILLRNLANEGTVEGVAANAGAILGCNFQSIAHVTMENCYSTGSVMGAIESAALSGWLGNNSPVVISCWTTAAVSGIQNEDRYAFRHENATVTNTFSLYGNQANRIEDEELENGSLCYKLNGDQSNIRWYQNIDNGKEADLFPTFMPGHGIVVVKAEMRCDGTYDPESAIYSNNGEAIIPPHSYVDGFCEVCGHEDEKYPFLRVFANADHDSAGGYTNIQSNDGSGLAINNSVAEHWNQKFFDTYQTISGLEKGVYKLRVQGLQRAKTWTSNDCAAYENCELDPEVALLHHNSQYYADVNGKRISNLFIDIAEGKQEERLSEANEAYHALTGYWVPNSLAACRVYFSKQLYCNEPIYFVVNSKEDEVKIGVENHMWLQGNWTVWDRWRLEKVEKSDEEIAELIRQQQEGNLQELDELEPQDSLMEAYNAAKEALESTTTIPELIELADPLSRLPEMIRLSHLAYIDYANAIEAIKLDVEAGEKLNGDYAELLYSYLNDNVEPTEDLPNGSYENILDTRSLNNDDLKNELVFINDLLQLAIKNNIKEGTEITNLIANADFTADGKFKDWVAVLTRQGDNFDSNAGYKDIYPVCRSKNSAFYVYQDLQEGLPNGIYELIVPGYYRTGDKGGGNFDGTDLVSADLFINDFHTPLENLYKFTLPYDEAINGVNCRYDSSGDPSAPHNGEDVSSQDVNTGYGYVPEGPFAMSFAFSAGRFINHAFAIVEDNKLRIGIQNTGTPWYPGGFTGWGKFRLVYRGMSDDALQSMMDNFQKHLDNLLLAQKDQYFYISMEHLTTIDSLISQANSESDKAKKIEIIKQINAEFNTINSSYEVYGNLNSMSDYLVKAIDTCEDDELSDRLWNKVDEIMDHLGYGDLTDDEARNYLTDIKDDQTLGGGFYVQGDLVDAEGQAIPYAELTKTYPLTRQADGTYSGVFTTQNRANLVHANTRAGFFFTRMNETYKSNQQYLCFVTPDNGNQRLVLGAGQDYQVSGGTFRVTINPADSTAVFETLDYNWNDRVFVCGSVIDNNGKEHRMVNDEMCPLQHQGDGIYTGTVQFFEDYMYPGYAIFTIMASRSTLDDVEYSTATRPGWLEASYGTSQTDSILTPGVITEGLQRGWGNNHRMRIDWTGNDKTQYYDITFDMNKRSILIDKIDDEDAIQRVIAEDDHSSAAGNVYYNLAGQRVAKRSAKRGIYITGGKKIVF